MPAAPPAANPHRRLHRVVFFAAALCLIVQVVEGALFVPFVLVYLGWPQASISEICGELYDLSYEDEGRECRYPYPPFFRDFTPEPNLETSKEHVFGPVTPPRPRYDVPGWREMLVRVEARRAAAANEGGADE